MNRGFVNTSARLASMGLLGAIVLLSSGSRDALAAADARASQGALAAFGVTEGSDETAVLDARAATAERETRLAELSARMRERGDLLCRELDVERNVREARERWDLAEDAMERAAALLQRFRDSHSLGEAARDRDDVLNQLLSEAAETLGEEQGPEFGEWLREKEARIHQLGEELARLSAEMGDSAAAVSRDAQAQAREFLERSQVSQELAESVHRDALEKIHRALENVHVDLPDNLDLQIEPGEIQEQLREELDRARVAHEQAMAGLHEALKRQPALAPQIHQQIHDALLQLNRISKDTLKEKSHEQMLKRLLEGSAKKVEGLAEQTRRQAARAREEADVRRVRERIEALRRARALEQTERVKARSKREGEESELRRSRVEIERLRRQVDELEKRVLELQSNRAERARNV